MNAERQVHAEDDDLTPAQLAKIYGEQDSEDGEGLAAQDRRFGRAPVDEDEQLDTKLIDKQHADVPPTEGEAR